MLRHGARSGIKVYGGGQKVVRETSGQSLTFPNSPTSGNVFDRIPIHAPAPRPIQTKLAVNEPGDEFEREADRLSAQVMRMPVPQTAAGGLRREAQQISAPPIVHEVLGSPGQPLDPAARAFMEQRFGRDFSRVRVHDDGKADDSARAIQALAYTSGDHIAFQAGHYAPGTAAGSRLLAHELVHTMQQGHGVVHRKIDFTQPKPKLVDPIPLVLGGSTDLGNTLPEFNGKPLPANAAKRVYQEAVYKVLRPTQVSSADTKDGKTCKVDADAFVIDVSAQVRAITKPGQE